jgi:predicted transcriptional regulator YdeE
MIRNSEILILPEFHIAGISIRTTNKDGQSQAAIGYLWSRFMSEGVLQQIPGRLSDDIYSVYTNYESDYTGEYTVILGCEVRPGIELPASLTGLTIVATKYQVNYLEGEMPGAVVEAWQQIWNAATNRAYTTDFEQYATNGEAKIYLAVNG